MGLRDSVCRRMQIQLASDNNVALLWHVFVRLMGDIGSIYRQHTFTTSCQIHSVNIEPKERYN